MSTATAVTNGAPAMVDLEGIDKTLVLAHESACRIDNPLQKADALLRIALAQMDLYRLSKEKK